MAVPRLDAERIALWRALRVCADSVQRRIDALLIDEQQLSLSWFEVLAAIRDGGWSVRVGQLCDRLGELPSSLSRRLDRMEEEGLIERLSTPAADDRRAVSVKVTRAGQQTWREANITYRRAVQQEFASMLSDGDVAALQRAVAKIDS